MAMRIIMAMRIDGENGFVIVNEVSQWSGF
jgi:hypothetical protein